MIIQRIGRTNPEKIFIVVRNDSSAAIGKGYPCCFIMDTTRDGIDVTDAKTADVARTNLLAGVVDQSLPAGQYGLAQAYGVRDDVVMLKAGSKSDGNAAIGDVLVLHTAISAFSGKAAGAVSGWFAGVVMGQTMASSASTATTTATVFLRLM